MNPKPGVRGTAELRILCGQHRTVPTRYKLKGVLREGDHSKRISQVVEIWRGRYKARIVTLKVLKVSLQDPHILAFKRVSMPCDPPAEGCSLLFLRTIGLLP